MPPPLRLAVTSVDPDTIDEEHEDGVYPSTGSTVWIQFVDATFAETTGTESVSKHERTEKARAVARTVSGVLPGKGTFCVVARIGSRWWILDGASQVNLIVGTLDGDFQNGLATGTLKQVLIGQVPHEVDDTVTVRNVIDWEHNPALMFEGAANRTFLALLVGDEYQALWVACAES
jgi:hypothetical protein